MNSLKISRPGRADRHLDADLADALLQRRHLDVDVDDAAADQRQEAREHEDDVVDVALATAACARARRRRRAGSRPAGGGSPSAAERAPSRTSAIASRSGMRNVTRSTRWYWSPSKRRVTSVGRHRDDAVAPAEDVVLAVAEAEDPLLQHADDRDGHVADAHRLADGVAVGEEDRDRLGAEDRDRRGGVDVVRGEAAALARSRSRRAPGSRRRCRGCRAPGRRTASARAPARPSGREMPSTADVVELLALVGVGRAQAEVRRLERRRRARP